MADTAILMCVCEKDRPEYFREALESILRQTHRALHVFLMVDGVIDHEIREVIQSCDHSRVFARYSADNCGLAHSLNALIDEVLGGTYQFLGRMDADDVSDRSRIEQQLAFLAERCDVDVLGTWCEEIDEAGNVLFLKRLPTSDQELKRRLIARCPFIHPTVVFRRRVFETGIRYRTDTHLTEDMFLWVDLAKAGFVFANLPESLLKYRIGSQFYAKRSGFRKAMSEFKAKRYIASQVPTSRIHGIVVPFTAFALRMLPGPLLKTCYRYLR